jgi:hypothetical protein
MAKFPLPDIKVIDGFTVVDDSVIGTKTRIAHHLVERCETDQVYYATTPVGASPIALAQACAEMGKRLTLLCTQISELNFTPALLRARDLGAKIRVSPSEDFKLVADWAQTLAHRENGFMPDFDSDAAIDIIAETAVALNIRPSKVFSASARGAMSRAYQIAWPEADHHAVVVLKLENADYGTAIPIYSQTPYEEPFEDPVPFACNPCYEAKAWDMMTKMEKPSEKTLFWNPAGPN